MITIEEFTAAILQRTDIEYKLEVETEYDDPAGHFASGDDAADAALVREIRERLERDDSWAWCTVKVTARLKGHTGVDYLGGCSYRDEKDFTTPGGYYDDMKVEAARDLARSLWDALLIIDSSGFEVRKNS